MSIWHKSLDDAQRAYNGDDLDKVSQILKKHLDSMGEESEIFIRLVRSFDDYKKKVWKLAHYNLTGKINIDKEWLDVLGKAHKSLDETVLLLGQLYSKLKKE